MQVQPPPTMLFWAPLGGTLYRGLPSNEPETPFADGLKFATDSQLYASNAATAGRGIVFEYMFSKPGAYVTFEWCVWHAKKPMPHCAWPPWVRNWLRTAAATDASLGVTDAQATEYLTTAVQGLLTNGTVVLGLRRPRREQLAAGGSAEFITPNFQRLEQWTLASQVLNSVQSLSSLSNSYRCRLWPSIGVPLHGCGQLITTVAHAAHCESVFG
eukprot:m.18314 g.18314  ORF g.18314 m.18314 type:complete len:214 (+) comp5299_c0_seq1:211-852(+)